MTSVLVHWEMENRLHWCLDATFAQDGNRTRSKNTAENLAVVRYFALNMLTQHTGDRLSIPRCRRRCDYCVEYRERILSVRSAAWNDRSIMHISLQWSKPCQSQLPAGTCLAIALTDGLARRSLSPLSPFESHPTPHTPGGKSVTKDHRFLYGWFANQATAITLRLP